jgi:hypothetical protein
VQNVEFDIIEVSFLLSGNLDSVPKRLYNPWTWNQELRIEGCGISL